MRSRTGLVALVSFVLGAAVACGSGTADRSGSSAAAPTTGQHTMRLAAATAAPTSPNQLRAQFEQLLGQHALLAVRQMRALDASLQTNTEALSRLVASAYGATQADRFTPLWQRHLVDLTSYAKGVAGNDTSATQAARTALVADANAYGSWLTGASKGRVTAGDAAAAVRMHVQELMDQADAYAAHHYDQAYRIERETKRLYPHRQLVAAEPQYALPA